MARGGLWKRQRGDRDSVDSPLLQGSKHPSDQGGDLSNSMYSEDDGGCSVTADSVISQSSGHPGFSSTQKIDRWNKLLKLKQQRNRKHRMVDRDASFKQSYGRWNIRRTRQNIEGLQALFDSDTFHSVVNMETSSILLIVMSFYVFIVSFFGSIYLVIALASDCNLGITNIQGALYFSLETMTTVGYGTKDVFFGGCWSVLITAFMQAFISIVTDAALIGLLFARLSRPQTRASTVVFSDKAVIRRVRGEAYFMFQVGELRKHQLLEAHVRCYAVRHDRTIPIGYGDGSDPACQSEVVWYQTHTMRLQHPDDELGSSLLLVTPQVVVHRMDAWSPMMPPPRWMSSHGIVTWGLHEDQTYVKAPWEEATKAAFAQKEEETHQRQEDARRREAEVVEEREREERERKPRVSMMPSWGKGSKEVPLAATHYGSTDEIGGGQVVEEGQGHGGGGESEGDEENGLTLQQHDYEDDDAEREEALDSLTPFSGLPDPVTGLVPSPSRSLRLPSMSRRSGSVGSVEEGSHLSDPMSDNSPGILSKRDSQYWNADTKAKAAGGVFPDGAFQKEDSKAEDDRKGPGYVYRFPDLLKRWDDVDGDRGTWYERMKRRVLSMERSRRESTTKKREKLERKALQKSRGLMQVPVPVGGCPGEQASWPPRSPGDDSADATVPASSETSGGTSFGETYDVGMGPDEWLALSEKQAVKAFMLDRELEVVVLIEGIDTSTGSTVQARHSYAAADIRWDAAFAPMVEKGPEGECVVDFSKFHDVTTAPADSMDFGFIQSYA